MCGIAGFHRLEGAPPLRLSGVLADELMLAIEHRGRHAAGVFALSDAGRGVLDKRAVNATRFVRTRKLLPQESRTVLVHTRYATTGARTLARDAHPQVSGDMVAIHNGTVSNADELFEAFALPRKAKVDSEIIPALIDSAGWSQAEQALSLMTGAVATAVLNKALPGELLLAKLRWNPVVFATVEDKGVVVFASTEEALRRAWWRTYGESLPATPKHLAGGEAVRINGTVEIVHIPGVWGVETAYDHRPWKPTKSKRSARKLPGATPTKRTRSSGKRTTTMPPVYVGKSKPPVGSILRNPKDGSWWKVDETPESRHGLRKTYRLEPYGGYGRAKAVKPAQLRRWLYVMTSAGHLNADNQATTTTGGTPRQTIGSGQLSLLAGPNERRVRQSHALSTQHTATELASYLDALDDARAKDEDVDSIAWSYAPGKYWD